MEDSIASRIEELKTFLGFTSDGKFADFVHLSRSNYSRMMSGGRTMGDGVINKICLYTKCNREWLTKGDGEMFDQEPVAIIKQEPKTDMGRLIDLLARQQKHIEELSEELERNNALIEELREQLNQTRL